METLTSEPIILDEVSECSKLFQAVVDMQKDLIVLIHDHAPVLFNRAFRDFTGIDTPKQFLREFGPLYNRFVPHDSYFHAGKTDNPEEWTEALMELPENDRIISMLSCRIEPHAFSVAVQNPVSGYTIVTFTDISQDLIKRIMTENDVSIDKPSGAYDKEYFLHTSKSFQDAAKFNKKRIGITIIELISSDTEIAQTHLRDFTFGIKSSIRQSDMLVRWGEKTFLLAYLIDTEENASVINSKLLEIICHEPYERLNNVDVRLGYAVSNEDDDIHSTIYRAEAAQQKSEDIHVIVG